MILVAATTASWLARSDVNLVMRWLENAEAMASYGGVRFFAALESHPEKREPLDPLVYRLSELEGEIWWFWMDDLEEEAQTNLRTRRVVTGRNLIIEYALHHRATHVLFLDADLIPPADSIPKLLEVDWPIVGGDVPAYCLSGDPVLNRRVWEGPHRWSISSAYYSFPVEEHWNTAGFLLVRAEVLQHVRWGWDPMDGLSDDPWFAREVEEVGFGKTLVRKDVVGDHIPLGQLEARPGIDRRLDR